MNDSGTLADLDVARIVLERLGLDPSALVSGTARDITVPTFGAYIPIVAAAVRDQTTRRSGGRGHRQDRATQRQHSQQHDGHDLGHQGVHVVGFTYLDPGPDHDDRDGGTQAVAVLLRRAMVDAAGAVALHVAVAADRARTGALAADVPRRRSTLMISRTVSTPCCVSPRHHAMITRSEARYESASARMAVPSMLDP